MGFFELLSKSWCGKTLRSSIIYYDAKNNNMQIRKSLLNEINDILPSVPTASSSKKLSPLDFFFYSFKYHLN